MEEERRGVTSELEPTTSFPKEPESVPLSDPFSPASPPPAPLNIPICHTMNTAPTDDTNSTPSGSKEQQHTRFTNPGDIFRQFSEAKLTSEGKSKECEEASDGEAGSLQSKQDPHLPKPRTVSWDAQLEHHEKESGEHQGSTRPQQDVQRLQPPVAIVS